MGVEEEGLTVWDIYYAILAVVACLIETDTDLGDAWAMRGKVNTRLGTAG